MMSPIRDKYPALAASLFSEEQVWHVKNRHNQVETNVHGPLAEILLKYPQDYNLTMLPDSVVNTYHMWRA